VLTRNNLPTRSRSDQQRARLPLLIRLHRGLLWLAALALFGWVLSGLLHPLMGLLGPRPLSFGAPALELRADALTAGLGSVLPQLDDARIARVVAGPDGPVWQLSADSRQPRRYLQLDGSPAALDDAAYARWLGEFYTGLHALRGPPVLMTEFDDDYPWVNRLLPVWRLDYDTPQQHSAYLHTETGSLTSYVDARKRVLQNTFRQVHTLAFLDQLPPLQLALICALMLALLVVACTGLLLALQRWGRSGTPTRRWHRRLGLVALLPVLVMAASGLLHAVVTRGPPQTPVLAAAPGLLATSFDALKIDPARWQQALPAQLDAAALRHGPEGHAWLVFRAAARAADAVPAHDGHHPTAAASAAPAGLQALQLDLPARSSIGLSELGEASVRSHLGALPAGQPRFGFDPDYDFRNRRLPAWGVIEPGSGDRLSFDPLTGQLLDRAPGSRRFEAWAFSWLHKWNPLSSVLGRIGRDALQAGWLLLALLVAGLGIALRLRRTQRPGARTRTS
jgi:hypothetical protein